MHVKRVFAGAFGAGLVLVGAGAAFAPRPLASMFGIPADEPAARAYLRATGARDVILGLLVAGSLRDARTLRFVLGCASLVGLADGIVLAALRGPRPSHVLHLGGFAAMAALALALDE